MRPRYPVYVISKGRAANCLTALFLQRDRVPFRLVVEGKEEEIYSRFRKHLLVLPFSDLGEGSTPARNFCWNHALEAGAERHWILDDNIGQVRRLYAGKRIPCASGPAFSAAETLVDRFSNVGIAGMNYQMFVTPESPPFRVNYHVYSCLLIRNDLPHRWRMRYNEDTDLCLQVLTDGLCTVQLCAFMVDKKTTMTMKGGNTSELYRGDGRLRMARSLEQAWPGVVSVGWRYGRPQHVVNWARFKHRLELRDGVDLEGVDSVDEHGLTLHAMNPVRSRALRRLYVEYHRRARERTPAAAASVPLTHQRSDC